MARCVVSAAFILLLPQLPSSASTPGSNDAPTLMLATSIVLAFAVTQSMPHMTEEVFPRALLLRTFTDHRRAPGAVPTTPAVSSLAAADPATWVPWPLPSPQARLSLPTQLRPPTTLRSGCLA